MFAQDISHFSLHVTNHHTFYCIFLFIILYWRNCPHHGRGQIPPTIAKSQIADQLNYVIISYCRIPAEAQADSKQKHVVFEKMLSVNLCYPVVGPDLPSLPEDGFWFRGIVVFNKSEGTPSSSCLVPMWRGLSLSSSQLSLCSIGVLRACSSLITP